MKLKKEIEARNLTQTKLREMCREFGHDISQSELSRLYSGKTTLTLYQLVALSAALGVSASRLLEPESDLDNSAVKGKGFIIDSADDMFEPYLGSFYVVLHSTSSFQDRCISQRLNVAYCFLLNEHFGECSVKESRGQPKNGALKQAIDK